MLLRVLVRMVGTAANGGMVGIGGSWWVLVGNGK